MSNIVKVRDLVIGEGIPKLCVPIVGKNKTQIIEETKKLNNKKVDLIEWRADYYEDVDNLENVINTLNQIRKEVTQLPILFTFRSKKEGGIKDISIEYYIKLIKHVSKSQLADLIDVELFIGDDVVKEIVDYVHNNNIKVIISNHDFDKTPKQSEIINILCKMQQLGGDLSKIAVMPNSPKDVLTLLSATDEMITKFATKPIVTMSMGKLGIVSRLTGEIFGSAITFGALSKASAPGQIDIEDLYNVLNLISIQK